jgi:4-hydroxy-tetrahydrodipicolinate reductase
MRLVIVGGSGRMGQAMTDGLHQLSDFTVVGLVDPTKPSHAVDIPWFQSINEVDPSSVDAVVEFSVPTSVPPTAQWCGKHGKSLVVGTTGLTDEQRRELMEAGKTTGVVWSSNFSLGAVLSERFAALAAPYFDSVEIIELHHDKKVDAPSGTSLAAAHEIARARSGAGLDPLKDSTDRMMVPGSRGGDAVDGIRIHSVRLPGLVAHQEILFGAPGEGLTIRHDSYDRKSFVHGVALALRGIGSTKGYIEGLSSFI